MTVFGYMYGMSGLFLILSVLFIYKKIGPNNFVGIRIGKALQNEKYWYQVHTFCGWSMFLSSAITFLYLISLQMLERYAAPDMNVQTPGLIGGLFLGVMGDAVIPTIYSFVMQDSESGTEGKVHIMDSFKTGYALFIYIWLCIVLIIGAAPLAFNKVSPNGNYGFRIQKTLASENVWYSANQFSGRAIMIAGLVSLVGILFIKFVPGITVSRYDNGLIYLLVFLLPQVISMLVSFFYILRL